MKFIQDTEKFEALKPYFIPAIYHPILVGKKKFYQLSISIDGKEQIIKKSSKKFVHTGFNKVITGAVMRMRKLFAPEKLNLEVILYKTPTHNALDLSFELVNKNTFTIGNETYFASIMVEYSYSKMEIVKYYPIIYRQTCSNGMVAVMAQNFSELVPADKLFKIGCEWTRCNFESYQRKVANYYELLKRPDLTSKKINENFEENALIKLQKVLKVNLKSISSETNMEVSPTRDAQNVIGRNREELGNSQFAVWNAITDFASRQNDVSVRNEMFMNAGKYLSNEMEKTLDKNQQLWSENLYWEEIDRMSKN
jgi:hypothetical protein